MATGNDQPPWEQLAAGVARRRLPGWDETVGAVAGPEGVLVVDAGPSLAAGAALHAEITELAGPPRWLAVTHPHFDHALGAGGFPGVEVLAGGPLPAAGLAADAVAHGLDRAEAERSAAALPTPARLVTEPLTLGLGGGRRAVLTPLGPAHAPHDLVVAVYDGAAEPSVVFCGDLVEESGEPQAGPDAEPARWPAALDRLLALGGGDAAYVPGHGAVVDAAFVRAQRAALARRFGVADGAG
ncbi:MBL fold metallo-hydrolase [Streptomyces sedi]|uniref:MBL fold metallo-hydrolase n=1 Tax=Streptomyces sedi TaxID=555059 RepID=A0A5C4VEG1_9ACTN|nr:MBL fold metallo-hydrolase [Streptomyces sedi]TNM34310.1 MBL fold metallo-hydrolase [Streptomyces sedi]